MYPVNGFLTVYLPYLRGPIEENAGLEAEKRSKTALPTIGSPPPANRTPFYRLQVLTNL